MKRYQFSMTRGALFLALALLILTNGCSSQKALGDRKEDWVKTTPPPQWRGPGQPGGPPAGALSAPPGPPSPVNGATTK